MRSDSVLTFRGSCSTPLTGEYSLLSITLDGPITSSSGVFEWPLSDLVTLDLLAPSSSSVNGLNWSASATVLWLRCDVASVVLARFGAGSVAYLLAPSEALLFLLESADGIHFLVW
jgi:hypothetical protein